jgi:GABA(A) receptor-associated protein
MIYNDKSFPCRTKDTLEKRKMLSKALFEKFPDRLPVIIEKSKTEKITSTINKSKFLVSQDTTVSEFMCILRKRMSVDENSSIYIFTNNKNKVLLSGSLSMGTIYNQHKDEDGFLYLEYCYENVFGNI